MLPARTAEEDGFKITIRSRSIALVPDPAVHRRADAIALTVGRKIEMGSSHDDVNPVGARTPARTPLERLIIETPPGS